MSYPYMSRWNNRNDEHVILFVIFVAIALSVAFTYYR